jgi:phosphoribosylamine--glycine ligase
MTQAENISLPVSDLRAVAAEVERLDIDLTVVGPEGPLAAGLVDLLVESGRRVFGPTASAARIEASKAFAKDVMLQAEVATAASGTFDNLPDALEYLDQHAEPLVVKASGLAAGKGAVICSTREEACLTVEEMLTGVAFGEAGRTVVIEEFLEGEELSVFAVTNGRDVRLLPAAQDHKRLLEGDEGPNTGGMGAYAPVRIATPELLDRVEHEVLLPTLQELERRGSPFRGMLYAGLMVTSDGTPTVIEFNCRFGDPETQVVLPLISSGLSDLLWAAAGAESLPEVTIAPGAAVTTVLAASGYPSSPTRGQRISIPDDLPDGALVFHAGTAVDEAGHLVTAGGRVVAVTAVADSFESARTVSRDCADRITFEGKQFRRDIGWREAGR